MVFWLVVGFIVLVLLLSRRKTSRRSIGDVAPGTMIVHFVDGSAEEHECSGTDEYDHQETAADYLCQPKHTHIEIKDSAGKVYQYDQAAMKTLGWL